jgi:hypothetical protein
MAVVAMAAVGECPTVEVLAVEECIAEAAVAAAFEARAVMAAADFEVGTGRLVARARAGIGMDLDGQAEAWREDLATAEAGLLKATVVRRLVWADERGWVHRTRH